MKKFFSLVLALVMALSLTTVAWGAPVADTAAAQAALDAATDGTTIQLAPGVAYGALTVVPTANSNTTYECDAHGAFTDAAAFQAHMAEAGWHGTPTYTTTLKNLTIVGAEGATVAGFVASSGHAYGTVHDYVLNKDVSGSAYYFILKIENLVFENVDFTGNVNICTSQAESVYDGVTFNGCSFTTGGTASSNGAAIRYYNEANNGNVKNLTVNNCSFENCYQGVYTGHVNGITVTDCTFEALGHNAVAVQDQGSCDHGNVVITENEFKNVNDRVIRFNEVGAGSDIIINNNVMEDCGDDAGELIKASSVDSAADVDLESNYWDGKDVSTAVVNFDEPAVVGITGGTWDSDVSSYVADGYTIVGNTVEKPSKKTNTYEDLYAKSTNDPATVAPVAVDIVVTPAKAVKYNKTTGYIEALGIVEHVNITGDPTDYVFVNTLKEADVVLYSDAAGKFVKFYLDAIETPEYVEGTLFTNFGEKCGQVDYDEDDGYKATLKYFTLKGTYGEFVLVEEAEEYACDGYVMYNNELVPFVALDLDKVAHKVVAESEDGEYTKVYCGVCGLNAVEAANRMSIPKGADTTGLPNYWYWPVVGGSVSTETKVESAATFDAGIAMYVGMSVMAAAGSVVVLKKRED